MGSSRSVSGRLVAENTPWWGVEVKNQREYRLAGHVVKLDLAPAQILSGSEWVDLAGFRGSLSSRGVIVRVLDVYFSPSFAGEDV